MLNVTIKNTQKVRATFYVTDKFGSSVVPSDTRWTVISGDATLEDIGNAAVPSAFLVSGSNLGDSVIRASVTADFGEGVQTVNQDITVTVLDPNTIPEGASLSVVFGVPQPK